MDGSALDRVTLDLPPAYRPARVESPAELFEQACARGREGAAGSLVYAECGRALAWAVALAPEEPFRRARAAFFAGMNALAAAIGSQAPPEKAIDFGWPGLLRFDGARLAAGRLGWPDGCADEEVPDWLVFSAGVIVSKRHFGEPGASPGSTSLEEEGFAADCGTRVIEVFARYLLGQFDLWSERGGSRVAQRYLELLGEPRGRSCTIDETGDCIVEQPGRQAQRLALLPALRAASWLDPGTGAPRL